MKKICVIVERSRDLFCAYADNIDKIYGCGETLSEVKQSIFECIEIVKSFDDRNIPAGLKGEYEIIWKFEISGLLAYYEGIFSRKGIAAVTGLTCEQIHDFTLGVKKPRGGQAKMIKRKLHRLGSDLLAIEL